MANMRRFEPVDPVGPDSRMPGSPRSLLLHNISDVELSSYDGTMPPSLVDFRMKLPAGCKVRPQMYSITSFFGASKSNLEIWLNKRMRSYVLSVLEQGIEKGTLEVHCEGECIKFGQHSGDDKHSTGIIRVTSNRAWSRIFFAGDLGFSEAYMLGELEIEDMKVLSDIWLSNRSQLNGLLTIAHQAFATFHKVASHFKGQSISRSLLNAIAGYSGSNCLFEAFLSKEMMYSCALWDDSEGGVNGDLDGVAKEDDLETAQKRKIMCVLKSAGIKPGDRILEFGSGWCGLAIAAARSFSCSVDTLTLSLDQKKLGEERIRAAGLQDLIRVHLMDYRQMPASFEKAFDAFISIEMIEHVGPSHYKTYFKLVDWALKSRNAAAIVTSSTLPESRYTEYQTPDFSRYYMWPNGTLPSATALVQTANLASSGRLIFYSLENHTQHYPRTLREWSRRFKRNVTEAIDKQIILEQPQLNNRKSLESFKRKWLYLFPTAEAGFSSGYISCHMLKFVRDI